MGWTGGAPSSNSRVERGAQKERSPPCRVECANAPQGELDQLAVARRIVTDGHQVVPAWHIRCADGDWLVLTRFDHDKLKRFIRIAPVKAALRSSG
jgi:hypothetical protein